MLSQYVGYWYPQSYLSTGKQYVDIHIQRDPALLESAVNVTALWDKTSGKPAYIITSVEGSHSRCIVPDGQPCEASPLENDDEENISSPYYFSATTIKVVCPARIPPYLEGIVVPLAS